MSFILRDFSSFVCLNIVLWVVIIVVYCGLRYWSRYCEIVLVLAGQKAWTEKRRDLLRYVFLGWGSVVQQQGRDTGQIGDEDIEMD